MYANSVVVDSVVFGAQTTDMGYARVPDGTGNFVIQSPIFNANNVNTSFPVNLKLYIQGYYLNAGLMQPVLLNQSVAGATTTMTDSITVELRETTAPYNEVASVQTILSTSGNASVTFQYPVLITWQFAIEMP